MDPLTIGSARYELLGQVKFGSGALVCSDPCYNNEGEGYLVARLQWPVWDAWILRQDCGQWGWRNARLILVRPGLQPNHDEIGNELTDGIGVDSGQAGFFDQIAFSERDERYLEAPFYPFDKIQTHDNREKWYRMCADRTLGDKSAGVVPEGVVASAGLGDGCYSLHELTAGKAGNPAYGADQIIQFTLLFLGENEMESPW